MRIHSLTCFFRYLTKLCDAGHADIDLLDFIPGAIVHNTGHRKIENILKNFHRLLCIFSVNTIYGDPRDQRIII